MSKITAVNIHEFEYDAVDVGVVHGHAVHQQGSKRRARLIAVRIDTADGVAGEYVPLWSAPPMSIGQIKSVAPLLVGHDLGERELLWDKARASLRKADKIGYGCLDVALWDGFGKLTGQPIAALAGKFRDRLPAYASTIHGNRHDSTGLNSVESYGEYAARCLAENFTGFKIHGMSDSDTDDLIAIVDSVADAVGGKMKIMLDAVQKPRTWADAHRLGQACDAAGLYWLEDPLQGNSLQGHVRLRQKLATPILLTELVRDFESKMALATSDATDFLRADPELDMGITGVLKIAHAAEALGMDVEIHGAGPAHRHCFAAIRNSNFYEMCSLHPHCGNPRMAPVFACGYSDLPKDVGEDGCVGVPAGPGLGVTYDWDFIRSHTTQTHTFTTPK
jgi:L-alanine-DL-glutamate epimerase-like enolase superfamily enzyme